MDDPLYDKSHRIIGFVGKLPNGQQVIRDKTHIIKGFLILRLTSQEIKPIEWLALVTN